MDSIELSSKLIEFKSVTPNSSGSLEYIEKILKKNKFECNHLEFGKDKIKNLYASIKSGKGPILCFAGHTDVVPPGDIKGWKTDPFKAVIKNGRLYGRGSSDMKTAIASFISATLKFLNENNFSFNGTISVLLTADEEGDAEYGTKGVVKWLKENKKKIDYCLVGEPTNPEKIGDMIKVGRRGSINFSLDILGEQGHVAYPEKTDNPIDITIKVLEKLQIPIDKGNKMFQPSKLVITSIDGVNNITNLTPAKINIKFNIRFNNDHKSKEIIKIINSRVRSVTSKYKISYKVSGEAFLSHSHVLNNAIIDAIKKITRKKPILSTSGGTSDARFITKICPVIEFGNVGKTMHKTNEMVEVKDITRLTKIYHQFLKNIFKK